MLHLTNEDNQLLNKIEQQLGIVADLSRAEALLYGALVEGRTKILSHAQPHSVTPAYAKNYQGTEVTLLDMPVVAGALNSGRRQKGQQGTLGDGAQVVIEVLPIYAPDNKRRVIGAISIDTSLLEYERHRRRQKVFRKALSQLQFMLTKGQLAGAETLSPFGEHDGLMVVDKTGTIRYTSGVAANLYRRLGYVSDLIGLNLKNINTHDERLFHRAAKKLQCLECESDDGGRHWVRKAIPLFANPGPGEKILALLGRPPRSPEFSGVLMVLSDLTETRRRAQEIRVKNAMIQEVHHRVKNNLQTIAALLRIQSRRVKDPAASVALQDATNRILSVAFIHEFLSDQGSSTINIKEVCQRIVTQLREGIIGPDKRIGFQVNGRSIWLPARQATATALVINELLQNSLEHGFESREQGDISINLRDEGDHVIITIHDDGEGLPDTFNAHNLSSLGLQIANTLVTEDLQGSLSFQNNGGATATITFPKAIFGGEEGWNENALS